MPVAAGKIASLIAQAHSAVGRQGVALQQGETGPNLGRLLEYSHASLLGKKASGELLHLPVDEEQHCCNAVHAHGGVRRVWSRTGEMPDLRATHKGDAGSVSLI
jgi:hypothetical protein